jgi:hypothetical protein
MVIGSTAMALQGMPVRPGDIDLAATRAGALEIGQRLSGFAVEPVHWRDSGAIASWFGRFTVCGIDVEVMGDLAVGSGEHRRLIRPEWPVPVTSVEVRGQSVPCQPLEAEARGYELFGRPDKAAAIRAFLESRPCG